MGFFPITKKARKNQSGGWKSQTDTPPEFELGDTAVDIQKRKEEREGQRGGNLRGYPYMQSFLFLHLLSASQSHPYGPKKRLHIWQVPAEESAIL